jgi:hypothetical protein
VHGQRRPGAEQGKDGAAGEERAADSKADGERSFADFPRGVGAALADGAILDPAYPPPLDWCCERRPSSAD